MGTLAERSPDSPVVTVPSSANIDEHHPLPPPPPSPRSVTFFMYAMDVFLQGQ